MYLKQSMIQTFNRKGYYPTSHITQRQFHILMNTFIAKSHTVFDQNITQEIWKQTEQRIEQQQYGTNKSGNIKNDNTNKNVININNTNSNINKKQMTPKLDQQKLQVLNTNTNNKSLKCQLIITTLIDAIQILTNRILQCEQRLQQLKTKRQQLQQDQNFSKLESLKQKIQIVTVDLKQFEKQFKMLTQPFMTQGSKMEFKKQLSLKRNQTLGRRLSDTRKQPQRLKIQQEQKLKKAQQQNQLPLTPRTKQALQKSPFREQKRCALFVLLFIIVLELSVCLLKFDFVNLLVELVGFLVLIQESHMPSMLKVAFYSCFLSVLMDSGWLFMYSKTYIDSDYNSDLNHHMKPYHQYIWFVTLLQLFIKLIYIYFLRSYDHKILAFEQQKKLQQQQIVMNDKYIPQVKRLANGDIDQGSKIINNNGNKKNTNGSNGQLKKVKNLTIDTNL